MKKRAKRLVNAAHLWGWMKSLLGLEAKVLTIQEAALLSEAEAHRLYTINVDDFAPQELAAKSAHNVKLKWLKFHIEQYSPLQ